MSNSGLLCNPANLDSSLMEGEGWPFRKHVLLEKKSYNDLRNTWPHTLKGSRVFPQWWVSL